MEASEALAEKLQRWENLKDQLLYYKDAEMKVRMEIAMEVSKGVPGKFHLNVFGREFVVSSNKTMKFDKDIFARLRRHLSPIEMEAVKLTPGIDKKNLKELPKDSILWEAIYEEPSAPTIKVKGEAEADE